MDDPPEALDVDERAELERLRREVAELRMDRQFLKKQRSSSPRRTRTRGHPVNTRTASTTVPVSSSGRRSAASGKSLSCPFQPETPRSRETNATRSVEVSDRRVRKSRSMSLFGRSPDAAPEP